MKKHRCLTLIVSTIAAVGLLGSVALAKKKEPSKPVVIKACSKKKPPVTFDHPAHVKYQKKRGQKCVTCHHLVKKNGKKVKPEHDRCSKCHLKKTSDDIGTCLDKSKKKNPFHIQCIGCHKKEKKKGAKKAAVKCKACHPKKK